LTPASIIPVFGSQRPYADLNFAGGSFGVGGQIVSDITRLPGFTFTRASTAMFYGSNGLLQTAASGVARFAYDPVTLASQGILVEEARTNLCLRSQAFDNASWTKGGGSFTADATTSPDGTANADLYTEVTGTSFGTIYQSIASAAGTYTGSVFFKVGSGSTRYIRLVVSSAATDFGYITVNVSTGAITQAAAVSGTATAPSGDVTSVGNGWYRVRLTVTLAAALNFIFVNPFDTGTPAVGSDYGRGAYTGNGSTFSLWQAQLELGTGASSPVPTTTAAVTRAADVAAVTGLSLAYPLSITVDAYRALDKGTDEFWAQVDDGGATNRTVVQVNPSDKLEVGVTTGGAGQGSSTSAASVPVGATSKAAARLATNSIAGALNGVLSPEDTAATMPSGPANLRIGSNQSGQAQPNYTISRIRIYNTALTGAQLQSLTT
jgi:Concanavalin A-like lectin/glucanases superfamily